VRAPKARGRKRGAARVHDDRGRLTAEFLADVNAGGLQSFTRTSKARRGGMLINLAVGLLFILIFGLWAVTLDSQFLYVVGIKHVHIVSWIEAGSLDAGMGIFTLLALGLARAGKPSPIERLCVIGCAAGSALMNLAATNPADPRAVLVYVVPALFLALVVDRVVSVVRRHYWDEDDSGSAWSQLGRVMLYTLRLLVAFPSTCAGARRYILAKTPLPAAPAKVIKVRADMDPQAVRQPKGQPAWLANAKVTALPLPPGNQGTKTFTPRPGTKTAHLIKLAAERHGGSLTAIPIDHTSAIATAISKEIGLNDGAARTALKKAVKAAHSTTAPQEATG
jgi:hypothetical protein